MIAIAASAKTGSRRSSPAAEHITSNILAKAFDTAVPDMLIISRTPQFR
jgi:hypothetical protein